MLRVLLHYAVDRGPNKPTCALVWCGHVWQQCGTDVATCRLLLSVMLDRCQLCVGRKAVSSHVQDQQPSQLCQRPVSIIKNRFSGWVQPRLPSAASTYQAAPELMPSASALALFPHWIGAQCMACLHCLGVQSGHNTHAACQTVRKPSS